MTDKLRDMIFDMEPKALQARSGAHLLANMLREQLDDDKYEADGLLFVAERLEEIVNDLAERREALHAEIVQTRTPPETPLGRLGNG